MVLAFLFGGFGVHRFYVGQAGYGIVFLLFSWTFIPAIIAIVDIFRYARMNQEQFAERYS